MSVLDRIAFYQGRRDEVPNQELAKALADSRNEKGIAEIAQGLTHDTQNVRSDCIKVLYEIGYLEPALIARYAEDFLQLLDNPINRLVWGGMTALATIAALRADLLCEHFDVITAAMESGSVITRDSGVRVVAGIASESKECRGRALAYLFRHLSTCRPKDVPQHSESALPAVTPDVRDEFVAVLESRLPELSSPQSSRVQKVIQEVRSLSESSAE